MDRSITWHLSYRREHVIDIIIKITFLVSVASGTILLLIAAGSQIYRKEAPISFLFVGLALIALPIASHIKVGPEGAELAIRDIRTEIAAVDAKVAAVAESKSGSSRNPIADKRLALVLYNSGSVADKNVVIRILRDNGYLSSPVASDYSELGSERQQYKPGQAYIKYEKGLEEDAQKIQSLLKSVDGMGTIVTKEVKSFRTGDIQIALF